MFGLRKLSHAWTGARRMWAMATDDSIWTRDGAWRTFFSEQGLSPPGGPSNVTEQKALTYSAVWAAVTIISQAIGVMGWHVFKRLEDGGKERQDSNDIDALIAMRPNDDMSSQAFRETLTGHALTWGNGFAEINRQGNKPVQLIPLTPDIVTPERNAAGDLI